MGWQLPARVLVVGLGRSGVAAARLAAHGGAEIVVTDLRPASELGEALTALPAGAVTCLGGHPPQSLDGVGLVVVSPGVPADAPIVVRARQRGIAVMSEVELAWRHRPEAPLAAITGSNGKSTVTTLLAELLLAGGLRAVAGGNLGTAASSLVLQGGWDVWVLEISSFQAEILEAMRSQVAVFLNLSQDHLERHPSMAAYRAAKQRLFALQGEDDVAVLNRDDPEVEPTPTAARRRTFSLASKADACLDGNVIVIDGAPLVAVDELGLSGQHNVANVMAATLAARAFGVPLVAMQAVLRSFTGLAHRHRTVCEANGVRWVDDSKATNVGATLAALKGYPQSSVHLILGGQGKGQDFRVLLPELERAVCRVYLIGEDGPQIGAAVAGCVPAEDCGTLAEAVGRARTLAQPGQWVVLAPACASFDQFSGYAERGDCFAALAREEV
jgi:UDP-N-acetylmuramoylalanine--D-glutamate ligase